MSRNETFIESPPERVFEILSDATLYPQWVVGAKRIRAADPEWPAPASRFHHTVGAGPVQLNDNTKVIEADKPRRLVMRTNFRPVGTAIVSIELVPEGHGTWIVMEEEPQRGPVKAIWNKGLDAIMHVRNAESLRRLKRLAEERAGRGPAGNSGG